MHIYTTAIFTGMTKGLPCHPQQCEHFSPLLIKQCASLALWHSSRHL